MNELQLRNQRRAVGESLKDYQKELLKAKEANNLEWVADCEFQIENLEATLKTIELVTNLVKLVAP